MKDLKLPSAPTKEESLKNENPPYKPSELLNIHGINADNTDKLKNNNNNENSSYNSEAKDQDLPSAPTWEEVNINNSYSN